MDIRQVHDKLPLRLLCHRTWRPVVLQTLRRRICDMCTASARLATCKLHFRNKHSTLDSHRTGTKASQTASLPTPAKQARTRRPRPFRFRQFELRHDECAMKMGTDAMLLGSWAHPTPDTRHILDIGTGSGVLALMLAQRSNPECRIHAIDVDLPACRQAAGNAMLSPWSQQIQIFLAGLEDLVDRQDPPPGDPLVPPSDAAQPTDSTDVHCPLDTITPHTCNCHAGSQPTQVVEGGSTAVTSQGASLGMVLQATDWRLPQGGYDLIISNPPYFINSYLPPGGTCTSDDDGQDGNVALTHSEGHLVSEGVVGSIQESHVALNQSSQTAAGQGDGFKARGGDAGDRPSRSGGADGSLDVSSGVHQRALARHAGAGDGRALTYEVLASGAVRLLRPGGVLYVVLPVDQGEMDRFAELATKEGLRLERCLQVFSTGDAINEKRRLMKFVFTPCTAASTGTQSNRDHILSDSSTADSDVTGGGQVTGGHHTLYDHQVSWERLVLLRGQDGPKALYTQDYMRFTWDFHHPSFFKSMGYEGTVPP